MAANIDFGSLGIVSIGVGMMETSGQMTELAPVSDRKELND
jgi:hypothetical protein